MLFSNNIGQAGRNHTTGDCVTAYFHKPTADLTGREDYNVPFGADNYTSCKVAADGNVVTYEWAFDWSFIHPGSEIKEGHKIQINYQFHLAAEGEEMAYVSYASLDDEEAKLYPEITLAAAPVVETEAVVEEVVEDAVVTAPQTFDAAVIAGISAVVSLAGYSIFKKQK